MKRLAIVATHPVQYYAPLFQSLAARCIIEPKIFYTWPNQHDDQFEPDFERNIKWDIPLLQGYSFEFVPNTSSDPGSHRFYGIVNPDLITLVSQYNPDALLVIGWAYKSHLQALRHFHGRIPVFFRGDSTLLDSKGGIKLILRKVFLRWVYRHVNAAFYVGEANKEYFSNYGLKQNQLIFAPHAVDNFRFRENPAAHQANAKQIRADIGISNEAIVILFVGKFIEKKNPLLLLSAYKRLSPDLKDKTALLYVGDGKLKDELLQEAKGESSVFFLPFQNQSRMPSIYRIGDLLCLPSIGPGETWGLAVNEAMACGIPPLVSSKVGCARDLVLKETGWVFKADDARDLIEKLTDAISNRHRLIEKGKRSFEHIQKYQYDKICEAVERALTRA